LRIVTLTGAELRSAAPRLAQLRIEVFRDFPYLYDGTLDYEREYLAALTASKDSIIVAALDGDEIVGCATGSGLRGTHAEFIEPFLAEPFQALGLNIGEVFYCGESVLSPAYRGLGLGHQFFNHREAHAKERGYKHAAFCAVTRPADHPLAPANYAPLDPFWHKRGYRKVAGMIASFSWKDVDQPAPTQHPMQFWMRELG
jgi:GNAT superfamily N-acetyltransferase